MMVLFPWKRIGLKKAMRKDTRAKEKDQIEVEKVVNMVAGKLVLGVLAVDVDEEKMVKVKERQGEDVATTKERAKESQRTARTRINRKERLDPTNVLCVLAMDIGALIAFRSHDLWKLTKSKNNLNSSHGLAILLHHNMFHIPVEVPSTQEYQHTSYSQLPTVSGATNASSSSFRPPSTSAGPTVCRIFPYMTSITILITFEFNTED